MKRLAYATVLLLVLLSFSAFAKTPSARADTQAQEGIAGYASSTGEIDRVINYMTIHNLGLYRMSFNPSWAHGPNPYDPSLVTYFLDHCEFTLILDRDHLYPHGINTHWIETKNDILDALAGIAIQYGNSRSDRLIVEIINECTQNDLAAQVQIVVTEIRNMGYVNALLVNKWTQTWNSMSSIVDPLGRLIFGYHYYFNTWSLSGAINDMNLALSYDLTIMNTEVGASSLEYKRFTSTNVGILNTFLDWGHINGISNLVWMNTDLDNAVRYATLGLAFNGEPFVYEPVFSTRTYSQNTGNTVMNIEGTEIEAQSSSLWPIAILIFSFMFVFLYVKGRLD